MDDTGHDASLPFRLKWHERGAVTTEYASANIIDIAEEDTKEHTVTMETGDIYAVPLGNTKL